MPIRAAWPPRYNSKHRTYHADESSLAGPHSVNDWVFDVAEENAIQLSPSMIKGHSDFTAIQKPIRLCGDAGGRHVAHAVAGQQHMYQKR